MPATVNLDEAADRPVRRDYAVGLSELSVGLIMLVIGSTSLLWKYQVSEVALWAGIAGSALAFLCIGKSMKKLRSSEEFPRIGYTKPRPLRVWKIDFRAAAVMLVIVLNCYIVLYAPGTGRLPPLEILWAGVAWAGSIYYFFYVGLKYHMRSAIGLGLFSIAWGALAYWRAGSNAWPWILLGLGCAMTLDGLWHFICFRRSHPTLEASES